MDRSAFAGSIATADRLLRVAVQDAEIPLVEAVRMLTAIPAKIMGLSDKGALAPEADADFAVLTEDLQIKSVFAKGKQVV
jgi:N-acetylglucosamine-6-phosphate deacetylase